MTFRERLQAWRYNLIPDHVIGEILSKRWADNAIPFLALVAVIAVFGTAIPGFFSPFSLLESTRQLGEFTIVVIGLTVVMLAGGIDLSVGMILVLANCLASWIVVGTALETSLGIIAVLVSGALCGAVNGLIVIFGRLQPIVTTIATGAMFYGLALFLRPFPGGAVNEALADFMTSKAFGFFPMSFVALAAVVLVVWVPYSRSVIGRASYAAGSSEHAAYMSGMPVKMAKFTAYVLSEIGRAHV